MFYAPSVLDRFENTGSVSLADAKAIGLAGVPARASGLNIDTRLDLTGNPSFTPATAKTGDVFARASVRRSELEYSASKIRQILDDLSETGVEKPSSLTDKTELTLPADSICVALTEAWRGELCHTAITDENGKFRAYKIVDPSFHNWFGLAMALRNQQISDFPICNKSFNLSYCGHDL